MNKTNNSKSGFFNPRLISAVLLCTMGLLLSIFTVAALPRTNRSAKARPAPNASPGSGTISMSTPSLTFTGGPFFIANVTAQAGDPVCTVPMSCDDFALTVDGTGITPNTKQVRISVEWPLSTADFDVYLLDMNGSVSGSSASSADPEVIVIPSTSASYTIRIVPFAPAGQSYSATVTLEDIPAAGASSDAPPPRYISYAPNPSNLPGADSAGEPSIGVDWNPNVPSLQDTTPPMKLNTGGVAFFTANLNEFRVNFDDCSSPAINVWEDVTSPTEGAETLDPIGFVDHQLPMSSGTESGTGLGRVFQDQLAGATSLLAYSDDDGNNWTQSQGSGQPAGVDHQTVGGGPYAPTDAAAGVIEPPHPTYRHQIYYASQDIGTAFAARSDTGGLTFNAGVPMWNITQCGGLHGHAKVGPDGTVYVPNKSCTDGTIPTMGASVAVSRDNGLTWTIKEIHEGSYVAGAADSDPSVGIGADNTLYVGYQNSDGHPHIAVSTDHGDTWHDVDAGGGLIKNTVFPEVVAGDGDRASFGFLGTSTPGGYTGTATFTGVWYFYIATTFDRGQTYTLVDATNGDPVQIGSICTGGTTCGGDRNLLDFNDLQIDAEGRVVAAYADGCLAPDCNPGTAGAHAPPYNESRSALASVIRQSGGPRLLTAFDSQANCTGSGAGLACVATVPGAPRVDRVVATGGVVHLDWSQPDNGGSALTGYNVYRKDSVTNTYAVIATVTQGCPQCKTSYDDPNAGAAGVSYFYKVTALNAVGESASCKEFPVGDAGPQQTTCDIPGITILTDPSGDIITPAGQDTNPGWDVRSLSISEPFALVTPNKLIFTLKVQDLTVVPPESRWPVQFLINGNTGTGYWVDMSSRAEDGGSPAAPVFRYGTFDPTGGTSGAYGAPTTVLGTADAASNYATDGTITIVVPRSVIGNPAVGAHLTGFLVRVRFGADALSVTPDNMPDSLAPSGDYTIVGNSFCAPNSAPVAQLIGYPAGTDMNTPPSGYPPLAIHFDASGSSDPDSGDTIASYTFNFGDGSAPVTQSSSMVDHTYTATGSFRATVTVTDSRGLDSSNVAQKQVEVLLPLNDVVSRKTHGANGTYDVDLLKSDGTADIECRVQQSGHLIVFTFGSGSNYTTTGSASSVTVSNGGTVASHGQGPGANQYMVTLTGVTNARKHLVTLNNVPVHNNNISGTDGNATLTKVPGQFNLLLGDTNNNGATDAVDVSQTKSNSGLPTNASNFRTDVTADGQVNAPDVSLVKSNSGTTFPASDAPGATARSAGSKR